MHIQNMHACFNIFQKQWALNPLQGKNTTCFCFRFVSKIDIGILRMISKNVSETPAISDHGILSLQDEALSREIQMKSSELVEYSDTTVCVVFNQVPCSHLRLATAWAKRSQLTMTHHPHTLTRTCCFWWLGEICYCAYTSKARTQLIVLGTGFWQDIIRMDNSEPA